MGTVDGVSDDRNLSVLDTKNEVNKSEIPMEQGNVPSELSVLESQKNNMDDSKEKEAKDSAATLTEVEKRKLRAARFGESKTPDQKSESVAKPATTSKAMAEAEKRKLRAERFGMPSAEAPKQTPDKDNKGTTAAVKAAVGANPEKAAEELEKRKQRAERFSLDMAAPEVVAWKQKAEKLGMNEQAIESTLQGKPVAKKAPLKTASAGGAAVVVKAAGLSEAELEKRKKRAERFGVSAEEKPAEKTTTGGLQQASDVSEEQKRGRKLEKSGAEALKNEVKKAAASSAAVPKPSAVSEEAAAEGSSEQDALEKAKMMKRAERFGLPVSDAADVAAKKKLRAEKFVPLVSNTKA